MSIYKRNEFNILSSILRHIQWDIKMYDIVGMTLTSFQSVVFFIPLSVSQGDSSGTCGDPGTPSHGSRDESDFRIRSKVHFSCSVGYELFGSTERMCFPNGTWSGTQPSCKRKHLQQLTWSSISQTATLTSHCTYSLSLGLVNSEVGHLSPKLLSREFVSTSHRLI